MSNANVQSNLEQGGSIFTTVSGLVLRLYSTVVSVLGTLVGVYAFYTILCNAGNSKPIENNYFDSLRTSFREWFTGGEASKSVIFLEIIMSIIIAGIIVGACIGLSFILKWIIDAARLEDGLPGSYKKSVERIVLNVLAIISFAAGIVLPVVNFAMTISDFSASSFVIYTLISFSTGCLLYCVFKALSFLVHNSAKH